MRSLFAALVIAAALTSCCKVGSTTEPLSGAALEAARVAAHDRAGAGFVSATARSPFVVVATSVVDRDDAVRTIEWAGSRLRRQLFDLEPAEPITVWVFGTEDEYRRGSSAQVGVVPDTPYGFYRPCSRALVVDAAYGWGTLIHEMVHAYMDADFPDAPPWLQEGLASLFENAVERDDGSIYGTTNWRRAALKTALSRKRAPSFDRLARAGRGDLHGDDGHLYYAAARYLCFWLQQRGLLERFYREHRRRKGDGLAVLRDVAAMETAALRTEWEVFVMALRHER